MDRPAPLPTGTVTFLFTDIEGSTRLLRRLDERYYGVLAEHHRLLRAAVQQSGGHEVLTEGDSIFFVFSDAADAVTAAVAAQRALAAHPWPRGAQVRVRMGLHTGLPTLMEASYVGLDVHRAARIKDAGHGGQVVLSQTTRDLVESDLPAGVRLLELGAHLLKDLPRPEPLCQLVIDGLPNEFPPLRCHDDRSHPLSLKRLAQRYLERDAQYQETKKRLRRAYEESERLRAEHSRLEQEIYAVWAADLPALQKLFLVQVLGRRYDEIGKKMTALQMEVMQSGHTF
jgi:class 3 adenylate cyclase